MYLKSIEVQGFKSFANKILFEFHDGITGIVGPNGSGKSNVADAVRWVLGEQSAKQLRGGNMQDVIFAGTQNRNPQSYAKVTIILENADHTLDIDFDEVAVTRKLYRSGESEYLLNGSPCRLKDIQELFYDTGIGKEGYSIIGQGQIDKILSGKPEDRRELFDEAAGIVKFKRRKAQTQKKLESEQANIVRVNDILEELERQVEPLKRQSEKAREYLGLRDELKEYDINMFLLNTGKTDSDTSELRDKLSQTDDEIKTSRDELEGIKESYELMDQEINDSQLEIEELRNRQNQTAILKEQLEGQINVLNEQLISQNLKDTHFGERKDQLKEEIDKRKKEKQRLEFENKDLRDSLSAASDAKKASDAAICELDDKLAHARQRLEENNSLVMESLADKAKISGSSERYDVLLEQNKKQKSEINRRLITLRSEEAQLKSGAKQYSDELIEISSVIKEKEDYLAGQKADSEALIGVIDNLDKKLSNAQDAYHMANSRLVSLKNISERYDGYGSAIKRVMEQKNKVRGIHGVVADVIKTEPEYELAIETALGSGIRNIIVDTRDDAKELIAYLKKNKFGRVTFLPLDAMEKRGGINDKEALGEKGAIGLASSLVKTDDKYIPVIESLIGRILVVEDIDSAIRISRKYKSRFQIVTKEGDNLRPGGSITGGAFKNTSNLLSRSREIEDLEKEVSGLKAELMRVSENKEKALRNRSQAQELIGGLVEDISKHRIRRNEIQLKFEDKKLKLDEVANTLNKLMEDNDSLEEQVEEIKLERKNIEDTLVNSEKQKKDAEKLIAVLEREIAAYEEKRIELAKQNEEASLSLMRFEQKNSFVNASMSKLDEEIADYSSQLDTLIEDKDNSAEFTKSKNRDIERLRDTIKEGENLISELAHEIADKEKSREELNLKHKKMLDKREELADHISELDKEKFRLESRIEALEESLEKSINYMWEEYELTYDSAKALRNEELNDISFMKRRVNELKRDIRNLGAVNVNAIEEYKGVRDRYEFLKVQRDDLTKAKETLLNIIAELDEGMTKQFSEQFELVASQYNKVFKQLFGGGQGCLELIEPENMLETGIRIIAQPPGKKLQNMMQLSGGEKALTAIALLFAIQNLKPSPFCLLDEIEAALDDSNVDRFSEYLRSMTDKIQFIVITHRRGTMNSADRLYGITMQEKGVSALVSVDLVEKALDD